jgi:cobalt/nickel transport system ATP-binding protein
MEIIKVKNFAVRRGGRIIFKNLNLTLFEGEKLILAGPNGVGKTSFAEALLGFVPFEGEFLFEGKPVKGEEDFKTVRKKIGYVFQNPDDQLFMPTVEEELAFGPENLGWPPKKVKETVRRVAEDLNLLHLLEKNTFELSFGQKRLVSIACVLTMEPKVLILDEPTNGLDRENWKRVTKFLEKTTKTVLLITHDPHLVEGLGWEIFDFERLERRKTEKVK